MLDCFAPSAEYHFKYYELDKLEQIGICDEICEDCVETESYNYDSQSYGVGVKKQEWAEDH